MSEAATIHDVLPVAYRAAEQEDLHWIRDTWVHSHAKSRPGSLIRRSVQRRLQRRLVDELLERSWTTVACDRESPSLLYGWVCFETTEPRVLHFAFVRPEFRQQGIGRRLVRVALGEDEEGLFSHWPVWRIAEGFADRDLVKRFPRCLYQPYAAR